MKRTKSVTKISFKPPGDEEYWINLNSETYENNNDDADQNKQAKEKLQNILLSSLQMQHLIVLAGSGCSISSGFPSMTDLWDSIVGNPPSKETKEYAEKVHYNISAKDRNIEEFLSKIEAYLNFTEDEGVKNYLAKCKGVIIEKCSIGRRTSNLDTHKTFLHKLSRRRARDPRLKIFTTNYDLCFEQAAEQLGCPVLNGFSFSTQRHFDPRYFTYDIIRRTSNGEELGQYLEGVFILHKLHGSVQWARDPDGSIYEKDNPKPEEACLIYPASDKYQQSYVQPYLESMSQYLSALRQPNTCIIVIGFGFNDNHLAEPLIAAAKSNPHLRVIIVDPTVKRKIDSDSAEEVNDLLINPYWSQLAKLNNHGEDLWFVQASFNDFANRIPDLKSLTPAESLLKAVKNAM